MYLKDGHPFPVPLRTYDESLAVLRRALDAAKLGQSDRLHGLARLDAFSRSIERCWQPEANVASVIAHERAISPTLGGRTVFDDSGGRRQRPARQTQGRLFSD